MAIILKTNKVNLFVSSVLLVFWYHSPNVLDTLHICNISWLRVNNLYFSPNIVWVIKSKRIKWAKHVARTGRREAYTGIWLRVLRERDHLGDQGVDVRKILRWIFRKWDVGGVD
jgi:hypothetical protein